jgi:hypothetical protein
MGEGNALTQALAHEEHAENGELHERAERHADHGAGEPEAPRERETDHDVHRAADQAGAGKRRVRLEARQATCEKPVHDREEHGRRRKSQFRRESGGPEHRSLQPIGSERQSEREDDRRHARNRGAQAQDPRRPRRFDRAKLRDVLGGGVAHRELAERCHRRNGRQHHRVLTERFGAELIRNREVHDERAALVESRGEEVEPDAGLHARRERGRAPQPRPPRPLHRFNR